IPLWVLGLLTAVKASQIDNVSAQPGENVTICCQHNSETGKNIHWFKQTKSSVPIAIVYMMISYELKELHTNYLNGFQQDHLLMSLNTENTSLQILNVDVSDSGLYFCGWNSWVMTFGDGTQLEIKDLNKRPISTRDCSVNIFYKLTFIFGGIIFILTIILLTTLIIKRQNRNTQGKDADGHETQHHEEPHSSVYARPISTRDCSVNIFYKLTFIFGGIIFILTIILLTTLIIKRQNRNTQGKDADGHETQHHEEPHSSVYAALQFSKHKSRRAARNTEDTDVVYSATRYGTRYKQALTQEAGVVNDITSYTDPDRKKLFSVE
ncbi:uncharacterized protein LOC107746514, partial [Sinocyclocheilus rhinocerous]|uniref:uncharacterized protein LOC107746514 n=1 Tax=Sinocyclocheilus rhinocerous TaxID=307959 RepID=UPI0007B83C49